MFYSILQLGAAVKRQLEKMAFILCYNVSRLPPISGPIHLLQKLTLNEDVPQTPQSSQPTVEVKPFESERARGFARAFTALRHRNYRLFWFGQLVSLTGTWMQSTAQGWLVLQLTDSAFLLGLVGALQFLPVLLFSLFGGVVADRVRKRDLILITQAAAMVLAFTLAILTSTGLVQIWHVMILAALLGLVNAFDMPTRQSFIVEMVGKEDLMNAIALNSSVFNVARIIGPAIAGLLIGRLGLAVCFYLNGLSFLAVIGGLMAMRIQSPTPPPTVRDSVWKNLSEGLGYIRQTAIVWFVILQLAVLSIFGMNFNVVIPVLARDVLNAGAEGYGLLLSAIGVGSLVGALFLAYFGRTPRLGLLLSAGFLFGALQVVAGGVRWFPLSSLLLVGIGVTFITITATANTLLQTTSPDRLRGRVMSVYTLVFAGSTPVGNLFAGTIAHTVDPAAPLVVGGLICAIATLFGWRLLEARKEVA